MRGICFLFRVNVWPCTPVLHLGRVTFIRILRVVCSRAKCFRARFPSSRLFIELRPTREKTETRSGSPCTAHASPRRTANTRFTPRVDSTRECTISKYDGVYSLFRARRREKVCSFDICLYSNRGVFFPRDPLRRDHGFLYLFIPSRYTATAAPPRDFLILAGQTSPYRIIFYT